MMHGTAVGFPSHFSARRARLFRKQHSRHAQYRPNRDLTKHPLSRMTLRFTVRTVAGIPCFCRGKTGPSFRVPRCLDGYRKVRDSSARACEPVIRWRTTTNWVYLHYTLRLGKGVVCKSAVADRRQPACIPAVGNVRPLQSQSAEPFPCAHRETDNGA